MLWDDQSVSMTDIVNMASWVCGWGSKLWEDLERQTQRDSRVSMTDIVKVWANTSWVTAPLAQLRWCWILSVDHHQDHHQQQW